MTRRIVVDTNVPLVAKGLSTASDDCVERCVDELVRILVGERCVVIDAGGRILEEYAHQLSHSGQPTVGDAFFKWLFLNQAVEGCCEQVEITPISDEKRLFEEFPADPDLAAFDVSDQKFVAVACAHPSRPHILQASDAKWVGWSVPLSRAGVQIQFVCEHEIRARYEEKFGEAKPAKAQLQPKRKGGRRRG